MTASSNHEIRSDETMANCWCETFRVLLFVADPAHIVAGSLTPPEKINGDPSGMATSSPLSIATVTQAIPAPPSPISTPSPLYAANSYTDRG